MRISTFHSWNSLRSTTLGCTPASSTHSAPTMSRREPWEEPLNMCWFSTKHPWPTQVLLNIIAFIYIYDVISLMSHRFIHCDISLIISPTDLESHQAGRCFGASIGISYENLSFRAGGKKCKKGGALEQGKTSHFHKPYQKCS